MLKKCFAACVGLAAAFTLIPPSVLAQSAGNGMPTRTPDGQPHLSGTFTFRTLTPMQRPAQFEGLETLTPEAAAAFEASERTRQNRDLFDPEKGQPSAGYQPRSDGGVLSYNEFWYERGVVRQDRSDHDETSHQQDVAATGVGVDKLRQSDRAPGTGDVHHADIDASFTLLERGLHCAGRLIPPATGSRRRHDGQHV